MSLKKRFSASIINEMAKSLSSRVYDDKLKAFDLEEDQIGRAIYELIYTAEQRAKLNDPETIGWFNCTSTVRVKFINPQNDTKVELGIKRYNEPGSYDRTRHYSDSTTDGGMTSTIQRSNDSIQVNGALPYPFSDIYTNMPVKADHPLIVRYVELCQERADLSAEKENFESEMINRFKEATNFHTLYQVWPEVRELLSDFEPPESKPKEKRLLPTFDSSALNVALGIPTENAITV